MHEETNVSRLSRLLGSTVLGLALLLTLLLGFGCSSPGDSPAAIPDGMTSSGGLNAPDAVAAEETETAMEPPPVEPSPEPPLPRAPATSLTEIGLVSAGTLAQGEAGPASYELVGRPPTAAPGRPATASRGMLTGGSADLARSWDQPASLQITSLGQASVASLEATDSFTEPYILLDKYGDYYGAGDVVITQVHGTFVDPDEAWLRYQAGDLDVIIPPEGEIDSIQDTAPYSTELSIFPVPATSYYGFSTDVSPMDNADLRAALSAAIDRERLISDTLSGDEFPALTFSPPGTFGHVDGYAEGVGHPYSPTVAQDLLASSGYTGTPTITLMFNTHPYNQAIAEAVRQMWIDTLNVTVTLESLEWDDYRDLLENGSPSERPGIYRMGWGGDYPDAYNFLSAFYSGSDSNYSRYDNVDFDRALDRALTSTMTSTRLSAYQEAESYLVMTDTAIAPLYYYAYYRMTVSDVVRSPSVWWGQHLDQWDFAGDGRPLHIAWGNLSTLDPALAYWQTDLNYVEQLFLGLTDFDEEGNVSGELATGWEISADGLVYTFTLRTDAYWTDRNPVTAHDVEYGILRTLDPETETPPDQPSYDYVLYVIENAQEYNNGTITDPEQVGVEALDDTTIVFHLSQPAAFFPSILALPVAYPQPEGAITAHGDMWTAPGNIVTNGPYQLSDWVQAPSLRIEKESSYNSSLGEGGNHSLRIRFWNEGGGVAPDVVITDTLVSGMTYITDTSLLTHTGGSGDPLVWHLGDLPPYSYGEFNLLVHIDAASGEWVTNTVQIETANPYDMGTEKESTWSDEVQPNDTYLGVDKWAWTDDPAPGYDVTFNVNVCNNGSTGSDEVVLTDTLHPSLTLQTWSADPPMWTEVVSSAHQLVLSNVSLPGGWCNSIYLRAHVDEGARQNMQLTNTVVITAGNDLDGNNNYAEWEGWVQHPYVNLNVDKSWAFGELYPGGNIGYNIGYGNNGNIPVTDTIRLTDTLPVSTSYSWAFQWGPEGPQPFTPTLIADDYVVWEFDELENGFWNNFNLILDIDEDASPGTVLTNIAEITEIPFERNLSDNASEVVETVNGYGPNLRVDKRHDWWGDGRLHYQINVTNVGDLSVYDVLITDTYPTDTTFNGEQRSDYWQGSTFTTTADALVWELQELQPGWRASVHFVVDVDNPPGEPLHTYTNTVEVMTVPGEVELADNAYTDVAFSGGEVQHVDLRVYGNDLNGCAYSGPVTVTTEHTQRFYGDACWGDGFDDPFLPGDTVTVTAGTGQMPVIFTVPDPFIANASSVTDTVWGQIDSLDGELLEIDLRDGMTLNRMTDGSGNFSALFPDIPRAGQGEVRYRTTVNYAQVTFHREFQTPDLVFTVDYDDDWVNGNYEEGHTVWLTLTESNETTVKATAELTTGPIPWWGGQSGFEASGDDWSPSNPDIVPGDWVFGLLHSNVYTSAVRVGTIDSGVDVDDNLVTGTLHVPWLVDPVMVNCEIHEENERSIQVHDVDPDGGSFSCDFSGGDSAYDIVPGTNVAINYVDPSGNRVQMHPDNPAPYLRIEKWSEGTPGQGGNMSFRIRYWNDGGMAASDVVITDVLEGMTYLTDTLGLTPSGSGIWGDPLVWNLGTVDPGVEGEFTVFAQVDEGAGNPVTNTAWIATSSPWDQGDPGEKTASWSGTVWPNATSMWINKGTWTWDPVPDTDFVYSLEACNGGEDNTSSSWTTVTDTLPVSTSLVYAWSDDPGWIPLRQEPHLLVWQRPTIDAHQCSRIYMRVHLTDTVSAGDWLCNNASIYAIDDISGTHDTEFCHQVGEANPNLSISKWWAGGTLVPGGTFYYHGGLQNNGNVPVSGVMITETVPVSTTLVRVTAYDYNWDFIEEITPVFVPPSQYVWNVATISNGMQINYEMEFQIDEDAAPGTVLTNTIAVSPAPDEGYLEDNVHTEVEQVFASGPNLRVRKDGNWHDWGSDTRQIEYNINIENVGDETVNDVFLTDIYPEGLYMAGDFGIDYWGWWNNGYDPTTGVFTVALEALHPGDGVGFNTYFITDTSPLPWGMIFTNTAIVDPSDPYPDDNIAQVALATGPDLWVEKELVAGDLLPGEIVTFNIAFGNDADVGWWGLRGDAWLTDTLPDAMTFVTSTLHWCGPWGEWCGVPPTYQDGNQLAWQMWPIENGNWNELHLAVEITDTVTGLDSYANWIEIASDQPMTDTEPYTDNNVAMATVDIELPYFTVGKAYESSRVAGMPVTYTLVVTNDGNAAGTNVVLSDTLPPELVHDTGVVDWTIPLIDPDGGLETRWFTATLPCTLHTITNEDYRVIDSSEGVTSTVGSPVALSVVAPTFSGGFDQSASAIMPNTSVAFTSTLTSDGPSIVAGLWHFGDGQTASGLSVSHVYTSADAFTVTLTVTDTCGFSTTTVETGAVLVNPYQIYLPMVMKQ